ncbi:MAG: hypothetical protein JWN48_5648 [Myxococcaceae bacterium]|nr:hypothetical protein [Myxococcaceae bacterium]
MSARPISWGRRALWALVALASACATPHVALQTGPAAPTELTEAQGLLAIQEALARAGVLAERGFEVTLAGQPFEADVRFADPPFAIEWLSAEQRAQAGASLPTSTETSPLQIASCEHEGMPVQMLVLDAAAYRYEANPLLVQRGAHGIEDAERRVRHDVTEFLSYVRDQGGQF